MDGNVRKEGEGTNNRVALNGRDKEGKEGEIMDEARERQEVTG